MNKKVLAIVAILVVLVGGYGAYRVYKHFKRLAAPVVQTQTSGTSETPSSLKDLLSKGIAQSCTFSSDASSGTVYVSSGKVRGDFGTTVDGNVTKSHMIVDGNTSYIWT